jgi:hypothetical protein
MAEEQEPASSIRPDQEPLNQQEAATTQIDTSEIVVSGPQANININKASPQDFMAIFEFGFQKGRDTHLQRGSLAKNLEESLLDKKEQKEAEETRTTGTSGKGRQQLETLDDIADWYENLPDQYTQCLVQTIACLHGAQATDIARLMKTIQATIVQEQPDNDKTSGQSTRPPTDRELYRLARIDRKRINGVLRLFWKDFDYAGQQRFTALVLRYLAEEMLFSGGADLTGILKNWAEREPRDCAWRAARALGIILFWRSSTQDLWRLANEWANNTAMKDWRNAASLLSGAYNVEWIEDEQRASNPRLSDILRLLNQWVERSQKLDGWRVGCAAAETYDLLNLHNPDIALDGLEKLLRFPTSGVSPDWESISTRLFTTSISNYVSGAWSGYIRNVLERLARHARMLVFQQQQFENITDELRYQGQCELHLEAVLTIFFLAAVFSFEDDPGRANYTLTEALPAQPTLPDPQGRDILLAGILSAPEQRWRETIASLLCTAFFTQKEEQALYVMRQWINTIETITPSDAEKRQSMQIAYQHFLVHLYHTIKVWENDPQRRGFGAIPASATFRYYLSSWLEEADWRGNTNSTFMRTFAQSILIELGG